MSDSNPIVGYGHCADGKHIPIRKDLADALWADVEREKAKRIADMPTEQDAIYAMVQAIRRLEELGWKDPTYVPKDGRLFDLIEPRSTGIHSGAYSGTWPSGSWWIYDEEVWPSQPVLARESKRDIK